MPIVLGSPELIRLNTLIEEHIRAEQGQSPIYVDLSNNLSRVLARQNHVVFGRRGSGKSTLLLSAKTQAAEQGILCVYFDSELIKENPHPELLISILTAIFKCFLAQSAHKERGIFRRLLRLMLPRKGQLSSRTRLAIEDLERLRTQPQIYDKTTETTVTQETKTGAEAQIGTDQARVGGRIDRTGTSTIKEATETTIVKIEHLQRDLELYHNLINENLHQLGKGIMLFVDDFYFIAKQNQPDVIDYLHRLCKGTNMFLKIGTIRYRTKLRRTNPHTGETIGVELDNDAFAIDLDYTLEQWGATSSFLDSILREFAQRASIDIDELDTLFTTGGKQLLQLASGGVPRDFLNLFLRSQSIAGRRMVQKLEKQRVVGEAARQYLGDVKRRNFTEDSIGDAVSLENLVDRIRQFAIVRKKKTVILVDQQEATWHPQEYDRLKQLMDLRFIHLVDSGTSATYGKGSRFEGYMLDVGLWATPRIPGLVEVDFDKRDAGGRKDELRNCPKFRLA